MVQSIDEVLEELEMLAERRRFRKLDFYQPYPKQALFHELGRTRRERLLRAGNQIGKTYAGAAETAIHLTGLYPPWWTGRVFPRPTRAWATGEGAVLTRDGPQNILCGTPGVEADFGTGLIPKHLFADTPSKSRGVTDAFDTIQVDHVTGEVSRKGRIKVVSDGISTLAFKSYDQGRQKHQTATLDFFWDDEEPPLDIYTEHMARLTNVPDGFGFITFTPLKGMSDVVAKFLKESHADRADIVMRLDDVPGMTPERKKQILAGYPSWQHDARSNGVPMQGSGRVFPYPDDMVTENPILYIPQHWRKLWGIDFGIAHPFGAVLILWDPDNDVIHVHAAVRMADTLPLQHATAMKAIAANVRVAWPQDGTQRRDDGKPLADQYRKQALLMMGEHARWPDGSISTEAGLLEWEQRIQTNRFKVSRLLMDGAWGDEFRNYHRDEEGKLVKVNDDLMSATRVAIMAKRHAQAGDILADDGRGQRPVRTQTKPIADGVDFDLFS